MITMTCSILWMPWAVEMGGPMEEGEGEGEVTGVGLGAGCEVQEATSKVPPRAASRGRLIGPVRVGCATAWRTLQPPDEKPRPGQRARRIRLSGFRIRGRPSFHSIQPRPVKLEIRRFALSRDTPIIWAISS